MADAIWWFLLADVACSALSAWVLYAIGRRSAHPVAVRTSISVGAAIAMFAALFYVTVWLVWRIAASD